jgi:hypothetical protein
MAEFAVGGKSCGFIIGIIRGVIVIQMTGSTICGQPCVLSARVTVRTAGCFVNAFQHKPIVIEDSSSPCVLVEMTGLTLGGESGRKMIRILGIPIIFVMTIETI